MLSSNAMPLDFAIILFFFAAVVPWLGRRRIRLLLRRVQTAKRDRLVLYASTIVFQWIASGVILWRTRAHHVYASELGVAVPNVGLIVFASVLLSGLVFANQVISLRKLASRPDQIKGAVPQLAMKIFPQDNSERAAFVVLSATVALCEEFIYRGFAQHTLQAWSGGYIAAGIVGSAALFALAHLYQGARGLISTFIVGIVFSGIRAWTGSILPAVLAHFVADGSAGLLAPTHIQRALESMQGQPNGASSQIDR
jgi:uncharacterized protein